MPPPDLETEIASRLDGGDLRGAATAALRAYGPEIARYFRAVLPDDATATEGFSLFCELFWRALAAFRRESSVRTFAYAVAWRAVRRLAADPYRRRMRRLATSEISGLAHELYSSSALLPGGEDPRIARLRALLTREEQTLLTLRIDRELSWRDIAAVFSADEGAPDEAALRKRFERLLSKLRKLAAEEGLTGGP